MQKFMVEITETAQINVDVEADSKEEAEKIARSMYQNGEYSLNAVNIIGAQFIAQPKQGKEVF